MTVDINKLVGFCDDILDARNCPDYCPNGLQVQGQNQITHLVSGVTACRELIRQAIAERAQALLVHHGYFWKGEDSRLVGMKYRRVKDLMDADISLIAYHLPLDIHNELGNNAYIGKILGIDTSADSVDLLSPKDKLGFVCDLPRRMAAVELYDLLKIQLGRQPLHIPAKEDGIIKRIAWCSGAAQGLIEQARVARADAYLSGEVSENTFHFAKENGIDYFAIGHHYSEVGGVQLLGERLVTEFGISHKFIDIPNPI